MTLSNAFKHTLLKKAHDINPVVTIAHKGLSENVCAEITQALLAHELIKIKIRADRDERQTLISEIFAKFPEAHEIQRIGQVLVIYQPKPEL